MNYASLMEKKASEWEAKWEAARQDRAQNVQLISVDSEIEKLSKELHELTTQEKEITRKRIDILNRLTATRKSLDNLLITFKAPEWIKEHPKPARKSPVKMSELQGILNSLTPEEREAFWTEAKNQKKSKRGGQSQ